MAQKKTPFGISPGGGKTVASSLSVDPSDLQKLIEKSISNAMKPVIEEIKSVNSKLDDIQKQLGENKQKTQVLETEMENIKTKEKRTDKKVLQVRKTQQLLEHQIIEIQMERARCQLRFQDIKEDPLEDLNKKMSRALAPLVKLKTEEFQKEVLAVYRASTEYTKRNQLPREVHLKLTNPKLRDCILKATNEKPLTLDGVKIKTLKEVPFLARKKRAEFKDLAGMLLKKKIEYIWLPVGLKFNYQKETFRITSEFKKMDFLKKYGAELGAESETKERRQAEEEEESSQTEEESDGGTSEEEQNKLSAAMAIEFSKMGLAKRRLRARKK